jgi:glucose/arabinose dehydrogenase
MQLILSFTQTTYTNHKGGQLAFGPDGYLYLGFGDGGSAGDPGNRAQNLGVFFGKILRIDTESTPNATGYRVPPSNPFVGQAGRRPEIWAYGLRNPWRFSFSPVGSLWIGDVGQDKYEEIDRMPTGAKGWNFGWSLYEGNHLYKAKTKKAGFRWPIAEYSHPYAQAITGGYVYAGTGVPGLQGIYVFADFITGRVLGLTQSGTTWVKHEFLHTAYGIDTLGLDRDGELWFADFNGGRIYRLVAKP